MNNKHIIVQGTLSNARSGNGFVTTKDLDSDVLVMQSDLLGALPGDTVEVRLHPPRSGDSRHMGRVVRIVERASRDIVGTLHSSGKFFYVSPISPTYKQTFHIADPKNAQPGERVVVRFTRWDNLQLNPEGEIIDVIGPADVPSLDTEVVIREFGLPGDFPPEVLAEAEQVAERLKRPGKREDLRDKLIVTIDPATARDYDDGISLEFDAQGQRVLGVHIADVGHFVRQGSAIDSEARTRGTSVYLVDKVIPMLPEQLSNGVCSLRPGEDRLTMSVFLTFNEAGRVVGRSFCRSRIRSRMRLSYGEALAIIEKRPLEGGKEVPPEVRRLISETHRLAQQLRAERFRRAALDLAVPEVQITVDKEGRMTGVHAASYDVSNELIEECMVAANEAVAMEMANRHIAHIARLHETPDPEKLGELSANLAGLGIEAGDLSKPANLTQLMRTLAKHPLRYYASMLVLRSMKRAEYNAEKTGHFGLAKKYYSHFTAPIRRYPDLVLHRQLALITDQRKTRQPSAKLLAEIALSSTETEFRAELASRELIEIKKYRFLQQQLDDGQPLEYDAVIVQIREFGMFVEVVDLQVSGLVHVSAISEHYARYDERRGTLSVPGSTYSVGQTVRVFVSGVNFDERKVDFALVQSRASKPRQTAKSRGQSPDPAPKRGKSRIKMVKPARKPGRKRRG